MIKNLFMLILIFLACANLAAAATGPTESLVKMGKSIDQADSETFLNLVNLDDILEKCLDTFIKEAQRPENKAQMPPLMTLMFSQAADPGGKGKALRELLRGEAKAFVINGINSGAFAGKKLKYSEASGLLAPLFANASLGRKEIRGIGEPVPADGNCSFVPFSVHDYGSESDYQIIGKLCPAGDVWRLESIENLEQIFNQIANEARSLGN